jgi:hypothetical protein
VGVLTLDSGDVAFPVVYQVGTHSFFAITGLYPFTLTHCGPSSPCVRFGDVVTFATAPLDTRCLVRAFEAGFCPRLTEASLARRSNKRRESFIDMIGYTRI